MADDLNKMLYSALHGRLSLKERTSLIRRYGGWSVLIPNMLAAVVFVVLGGLLTNFIRFYYGREVSLLAMFALVALAAWLGRLFVKRRNRRVYERVMSNLVQRGVRPHFCLNCKYDLKGSTSACCPECGTPLALIGVDGIDGV